MGGLLDALMAFDFAKAVTDNEIALMLKQIKRGYQFSEENFALDQMAEVGPGGMFAGTEHTLERMRTTMLLAEVADRDPRAQWLERGGEDTQARALRRAKQILTRTNPDVLPPEIDAQVRAAFPGLVAGDSLPPEGWTRVAEPLVDEEDGAGTRRRRRRQQRVMS
jgi:trimethylamine--corrinoid protein Co-methyltransferase